MASKALSLIAMLGLVLLLLLAQSAPPAPVPVRIASATSPVGGRAAPAAAPRAVLTAEEAWLRQPPTPLDALRRAAGVYFPEMFDGSPTALPARFDAGANPCWGGKHCLPAFLILGVYQSGVRDFYTRLALHPGVARRAANSPSYYSQVHPKWDAYVRSLDAVAPQALGGRMLGEASAVTFHFVWVHQEKFNGPYVESMGRFWRECNTRTAAEKDALPHRECMARRMGEAREADAALARRAGLPKIPDVGAVAQERAFSVPQLMRAAYGEYAPALIVLLRRPWARMHASFYNYPHYRRRFGEGDEGEVLRRAGSQRRARMMSPADPRASLRRSLIAIHVWHSCLALTPGVHAWHSRPAFTLGIHVRQVRWVDESIGAFRRCESNFTTDHCALSFESLSRGADTCAFTCAYTRVHLHV